MIFCLCVQRLCFIHLFTMWRRSPSRLGISVCLRLPHLARFMSTVGTQSTVSARPTFRMDTSFVDTYRDIPAPFGYNGLGEAVYRRTYSRIDPVTGKNEEWVDTVQRVIEGTYTMQKRHCLGHKLHWCETKAMKSARKMFDRIFNMKFLPPGRGLWAM